MLCGGGLRHALSRLLGWVLTRKITNKYKNEEQNKKSREFYMFKSKEIEGEIPDTSVCFHISFFFSSLGHHFFLRNGSEINEINATQGAKGEHGKSPNSWDGVPIKFRRPVGKRAMAEVVHVAATRLVC